MARRVIIEFDQSGNMKADAQGFVGASCEEATRNILGAMQSSAGDTKVTEKPEMLQADAGVAQVQGRW